MRNYTKEVLLLTTVIIGLTLTVNASVARKESMKAREYVSLISMPVCAEKPIPFNETADKQTFSSQKSKHLISKLQTIVENTEERFDQLSKKEWDETDEKVKKLDEEFELIRDNMPTFEQEEYNKLRGRYLALKAKKSGKSVEQYLKDTKSKAKGFFEGLKK